VSTMNKRGYAKATPLVKNETSKAKKRKNIVIPQKLIDNDSLELVASPVGPIRTYAVTHLDKDIILERLEKEIVKKFHFTLSPSNGSLSSKRKRVELPEGDAEIMEKKLKMQAFMKARMTIGTNSCSRAFENISRAKEQSEDSTLVDTNSLSSLPKDRKISLCVLARDVRPASILSHIPYLCLLHNVPILLLPGKASHDLGMVLGGKKVSVLLFDCCASDDLQGAEKKWLKLINSYIDFIKAKIPLTHCDNES